MTIYQEREYAKFMPSVAFGMLFSLRTRYVSIPPIFKSSFYLLIVNLILFHCHVLSICNGSWQLGFQRNYIHIIDHLATDRPECLSYSLMDLLLLSIGSKCTGDRKMSISS
jgi:hypothetical protein